MEGNGCTAMKPDDKSCGTEKKGPCGDKKGCCWTTLIKGAIAGGGIMFIYISISWMVLPWHKTTMMSFGNEGIVSTAINSGAQESGVYVISGATEESKETKTGKVAHALGLEKPFVFASVYKGGAGSKDMNRALLQQAALCFVMALLLTCLLKKTAGCGCPVFFSMKTGLLVAIASHAPAWIWFHFPTNYTLVGMVDHFIAITLAGLVISKCVLKSGACTAGDKGDCGEKKGSCH